MLTIRDAQMLELRRARTEDFMLRALGLLRSRHPGYCQGLDEATLRGQVDAVWAYCRSVEVRGERSVLRMIDLHARARTDWPPTGFLAYLLTQPCLDETTRVAHFEQALMQEQRPTLIALDTVLAAEGRPHA